MVAAVDFHTFADGVIADAACAFVWLDFRDVYSSFVADDDEELLSAVKKKTQMEPLEK